MPRLTGQQIKTIAIVAMLLDHIAWAFLDLHSFWGQLLHIIGRITAPTMCFFIVEGYHHTRSVPKYLTRLFLFALISHFPFVYFLYGKFTFFPFCVLYTLALGLSAVYLWDRLQNNPWRLPLIIAIAVLSLPGDWMCFGIGFCLIFHIYRRNFSQQAVGISYIALVFALSQFFGSLTTGASWQSALLDSGFQLGLILSIPLLALYNGERGGSKYSKWIFYWFYPAHLLILGFLIHAV